MQRGTRNTQTAVKSFSGVIVLLGVVYLFLVSDVSEDEAKKMTSFDPISIVRHPQAPDDTCRALFTISQAMDQFSLQNRSYSKGDELEWRSSAVAKTLQELLQKRASPFGAPSSYYYSLAEYLPKLVSFRDDKLGVKDSKVQTKDYGGEMQGNLTNLPFLNGRSRIASGGGVLPQVPCFIASYEQPAAFSHCVRRRLKRSPQLWLYFMGDSKIRNVFMELIQRTDSEYKYAISYLNATESWQKVKQKLGHDKVRWTDMEATTLAEPGLRISFSFKKFNQRDQSKFNKDIKMLHEWASGEPLPDLLVVGYTTWMFVLTKLLTGNNMHIIDILDLLMEKHSVVVPLLEKISSRSRVLVLPQSRLRPNSEAPLVARSTFTEAIFDWSEMSFLHVLRRYRESHGGDGAGREDPRPQGTSDQSFKDHLIPTEGSASYGLWWWDTSLPLNLAGILECNELYSRGLGSHPIYYEDTTLHCEDAMHAGRATNTDLVTMIFNLLCNSVAGMDRHYCCT